MYTPRLNTLSRWKIGSCLSFHKSILSLMSPIPRFPIYPIPISRSIIVLLHVRWSDVVGFPMSMCIACAWRCVLHFLFCIFDRCVLFVILFFWVSWLWRDGTVEISIYIDRYGWINGCMYDVDVDVSGNNIIQSSFTLHPLYVSSQTSLI